MPGSASHWETARRYGREKKNGGGNLFRVAVQTPLHLAAVNGNGGRGLAAETNLAAVDGQKGDFNFIVNHDGFAGAAGQNQQGFLR